jgi:hypothetical protein
MTGGWFAGEETAPAEAVGDDPPLHATMETRHDAPTSKQMPRGLKRFEFAMRWTVVILLPNFPPKVMAYSHASKE